MLEDDEGEEVNANERIKYFIRNPRLGSKTMKEKSGFLRRDPMIDSTYGTA